MDKKIRLPAVLIISSPILMVIWYVHNIDKIGTMLFGETLDHCNVIGCTVTRDRFFPIVTALAIVFIIGIILLIHRTRTGAAHAKDQS